MRSSAARSRGREPRLLVLQILRGLAVRDHRLHRADRREHPADRARPRGRVRGQEARVAGRDVKHDRPGLEEGHLAILEGGDLPERLDRPVRRRLHRGEGDRADVVGLADLLERPAHAHVARHALAAVRRAFEGGDGDAHGGILTAGEVERGRSPGPRAGMTCRRRGPRWPSVIGRGPAADRGRARDAAPARRGSSEGRSCRGRGRRRTEGRRRS